MADATIGVAQSGSPDRLLDATSLTVSAQTVWRERHNIAGASAAELMDVRSSAPSSGDYGAVVRQVGMPAAGALADGASNPTLTQLAAFGLIWNGSTWDRDRGRAPGHTFYGACLPSGTVSSGTSSSTQVSLGYLWHPSSVTTLRYFLRRIGVVWMPGASDDTAPASLRLVRISAENGTPGGTSQTIQGFDPGAAASGGTFRTGATGAPTRGNVIRSIPISLNVYGSEYFEAPGQGIEDNPWQCRKSTAEGWEVQLITSGTAPTTAALFGVFAEWSETAL